MIIRRKTYETLKNNNEFLAKVNAELRKDNLKFQYATQEANNLNEKLACDIDDLKRQVKNLKSLCTKNKVDYKSLYKKEK